MNLLDLNLLYLHKDVYIKKATKSLYNSDTHKVNKTIINNFTTVFHESCFLSLAITNMGDFVPRILIGYSSSKGRYDWSEVRTL